MHAFTKRVALSVSALTVTLVLSACGGKAGTSAGMPGHDMSAMNTPAASAPASPGAQVNDADVMFAQMMIPHHQQALEVAQLATTKAVNPR
jgi:uncharacterized protein (DUF305 family)